MSAGFFGSYFRKKQKKEEQESAAASRPAPEPSGEPGARAGREDAANPYLQYGLRGGPTQADGLGRPAVEEGPAGAGALEAAPGRAPEPGAPSLGEVMRDSVVVALLREEVVTLPQALAALGAHKRQPETALWRLLAGAGGVDRANVYAVAAEALGFERAAVTDATPTNDLIETVHGMFSPAVGDALLQLGLLPYELSVDPVSGHHSLVLVTHDPADPDVTQFTAGLGLRLTLRHAPEAVVAQRLRRWQGMAAAQAEAAGRSEAAAVTTGFTFDDLIRATQTDFQADVDVAVEVGFAPAAPERLSGDGHPDREPPGLPFEPDAGDEAYAPEAGWEDEAAAPPAEPAPSEERSEERAIDPAALESITSRDRVVAMLLRKEIVTPQQVHEAQQRQKRERSKEALWRFLAQSEHVDQEAIYAEAARVYAFKVTQLGEGKPDPEFARSVIDTFSEERRAELFKLRLLPLECDLEHQTGAIKLVFVTHDPTRPEVHRLMQQLKLERFELRYAPKSQIAAAMAEVFPRKNEFLERMAEEQGAFDLGTSYEEEAGLIDEDALEAEIGRSTLINLFEATLMEAVRQGASDIHIYPNAQKKVEIHFRVDGRLNHWHTEEKVHPEALLAVIKDNATNVDRFERDAAQDGFIQRWIDEALIRFRVSVLPIANASQELRSESIVIRVLDDRKVITDLARLGLLSTALDRFDHAIRQPHGMVILTGPTGSGKSTTLVAALHQVVTPEVNVLTVEDPVEYIIPGVRQIKLNHKLGLEDALRSILRHDPDVVMVGEMRDRHTAELAIKLANTGHLTFSTLHTNDAPAAISRLYKMGVEPFLIAYAINLVVAQRLIRTLCSACKTVDDDPDHVMLEKLGFTEQEIAATTIYQPSHDQSCKVCKGIGYKGRRAVSEALHFSRAIRHMIVEADKMIDEGAIRDLAVKEGMLTLADSAREIVKMGDTSVMEMVRVVTTES